MDCPRCGAALSEKAFCTSCGEDVHIYKKIISRSNGYYNEGLAKAKVRDLSGAIESLHRSLKYNKRNTMARNLLGLVYFESGEVVEALSQWVISKNFQPEKNIADDYIQEVQSNPGRLEAINQTIKKFNLALRYCKQGNDDMAIIQLKKVLTMNEKFVQAYQLLGLLYIQTQEYDLARKTLNRALRIDASNTKTLKYLREVKHIMGEGRTKNKKKNSTVRKGNKIISYQDGNETIIQPMAYKESTGVSALINIIIGLVIGLAVAWFLIIPARQDAMKENYKEQNITLSEELASQKAEKSTMEKTIQALNKELETAKGQASSSTTVVTSYNGLIKAAQAHMNGDAAAVVTALAEVKADGLSQEANALYGTLNGQYAGQAVTILASEGYELYQAKDYKNALAKFDAALKLDGNHVQSLYYAARCYQADETLLPDVAKRNETIKNLFSKVLELEPNGNFAKYAKSNMPQ